MFSKSLRLDDHIRRYSITPVLDAGWDVKLEEDHQLVRVAHFDDWHRVERMLAIFSLTVGQLAAQGWQEVPN